MEAVPACTRALCQLITAAAFDRWSPGNLWHLNCRGRAPGTKRTGRRRQPFPPIVVVTVGRPPILGGHTVATVNGCAALMRRSTEVLIRPIAPVGRVFDHRWGEKLVSGLMGLGGVPSISRRLVDMNLGFLPALSVRTGWAAGLLEFCV